jgi:hypothetical protein
MSAPRLRNQAALERCSGCAKILYPNWRVANSARTSMTYYWREPFSVYPCPHEKGYHTGSATHEKVARQKLRYGRRERRAWQRELRVHEWRYRSAA